MLEQLAPDRDATDGRQTRRGLGSLAPDLLHDVLKAIWWEARDLRAAIHRLVGVPRCDVVLVAGALRLGAGRPAPAGPQLYIDGDCPCRDYVADLLVECDRFLDRTYGTLTNPPGAVRRHIRIRASGDWTRSRRAAMGAQVRADRIRASARARSLPDEFHRAVLEYLVDEAGSLAPLESDDHLDRRLAVRAAAEFGGHPADRLPQVRAAAVLVEAVCRTGPRSDPGDGSRLTWWERYVEHPLGRRTRRGDAEIAGSIDRAAQLACGAAGRALEEVVDPLARYMPLDQLLAATQDSATRDELARLLVDAVLALADAGRVPPTVAARFVRDPRRVDAAVAVLVEVGTG